MIKNVTCLEEKVNGKMYQFICDGDSPLSDIKDVLCQYLVIVKNAETAALEKQQSEAAANSEPDIKEVPKE